ncbi:MAG: UvrD-helicase domain-containing protein, partial [Acidobacteriota bacterium]|nr:UvrD-helicase domain-containing protein [Acidobacteriota bacterium]
SAVLDARESDEQQSECLHATLDELVAGQRETALALMETLQNARIAEDLKCAWDGIRSSGKTIEEIRAVPSPLPNLTPPSAALQLKAMLSRWPPRFHLTAVQREEFDGLSAWADTNFAAPYTINLRRVPEPFRPELKQFREDLAVAEIDRRTAPFREVMFDILSRFEALYEERKTERAALDFNDLERCTIALLNGNSEVREKVRLQFRQIMLDEFQDINEQQAELIRLIRDEDVFFAVGDINQSIYGFRHARPEIFEQYQRTVEEEGKQSVALMHNFRSREPILRAVESLLNSADGIRPHTLEAAAQFAPKSGPSIEILRILDDGEEEETGIREARWIAYRILEMHAEFEFSKFAVLCRSHDAMKPILNEFDRVGIPYVCGRRQSFLLSREGLDIRALLSIVANPRDEISLATVLRSSLVSLSDEALLWMRLTAGGLNAGLNLQEFPDFAQEDVDKIRRFRSDLKRWRDDQPVIALDLLIVRMLSDCGFTPNENVEAFLKLARANGGRLGLLEFLRELESMESAVSAESELSDEDQGNTVQVMTAHAAKGLEFAVTIIAAMHKDPRRTGAGVTFTPEHGLGLRWKSPGAGDGVKDSWARANSERLKRREKEEEHRLLYVAMTRAGEHLILSYSWDGRRAGGWAKLLEPGDSIAFDPPPLQGAATSKGPSHFVPSIPRPILTDQHDAAVTVTSLAVFAKCPRKYYLQRYVGWTGGLSAVDAADFEAEEDDLSAAETGSSVHEILAGKQGNYSRQAQELANVFLHSELGQRARNSAQTRREWEFIADVSGTLLRGSVDLWFEENGEIQLVDYKTDRKPNPTDYAPQLALYALAIERAVGKRPAGAYLHFLRSNTVSEVAVDQAAIDRAQTLIGELGQAQNNLQFDLRVGPHCHACQFYGSLCPAQL